jgi:hypothetical protein
MLVLRVALMDDEQHKEPNGLAALVQGEEKHRQQQPPPTTGPRHL